MLQPAAKGSLLLPALVAFVAAQHTWEQRPQRTAVPLPRPTTTRSLYGPAFSEATSYLDSTLSFISLATPSLNTASTIPTDATSTLSASAEYNQAAYDNLWVSLVNVTTAPYTTTRNATPVATSELIYPTLHINDPSPANYSFGPHFSWGFDSSSNQYEGAISEGGRSPSVLDKFFHQPLIQAIGYINADVVGLGYYNYRQDIARLAAIGVPTFTFSIAWPRVVPFGYAGSPVNEEALAHYDDVINTCIEYGVEPSVTIYHWDTPAHLARNSQDVLNTTLGFLKSGTSEPDFAENIIYYGKIVLSRYADRVSHWTTFNEPQVTADNGDGIFQILTAHAELYDFYKNTLNGTGTMTFKNANTFAMPYDPNNSSDIAAANRLNDLSLGIFCNPTFLGIDVPAAFRNTSGLSMPELSPEFLQKLNGSNDYFAVDMYQTTLARAPAGGIDACAANSSDPLWPLCAVQTSIDVSGFSIIYSDNDGNLGATAASIREWLRYIWNTFHPTSITVAEFGYADDAPIVVENLAVTRQDVLRTNQLLTYLDAMLRAEVEDGIIMSGAYAWAFLDMWEFGRSSYTLGAQGYDPITQERYFKASMFAVVDYLTRHTHNATANGTSASASMSVSPRQSTMV